LLRLDFLRFLADDFPEGQKGLIELERCVRFVELSISSLLRATTDPELRVNEVSQDTKEVETQGGGLTVIGGGKSLLVNEV
jgi:hypothetical protein